MEFTNSWTNLFQSFNPVGMTNFRKAARPLYRSRVPDPLRYNNPRDDWEDSATCDLNHLKLMKKSLIFWGKWIDK